MCINVSSIVDLGQHIPVFFVMTYAYHYLFDLKKPLCKLPVDALLAMSCQWFFPLVSNLNEVYLCPCR